jgi:hypothetical protein
LASRDGYSTLLNPHGLKIAVCGGNDFFAPMRLEAIVKPGKGIGVCGGNEFFAPMRYLSLTDKNDHGSSWGDSFSGADLHRVGEPAVGGSCLDPLVFLDLVDSPLATAQLRRTVTLPQQSVLTHYLAMIGFPTNG